MNEIVALDVKKEEEAFMNQIIVSKGNNLPGTIEEVVNVFEFTDFKARAWKILAHKTSKLEEQAELHQSAIRSGQQWGIAALYAQKRMGEITREMPKIVGKRNDLTYDHYGTQVKGKMKTLEENGIHRKNYVFAEQMANNPEVIEEVIQEAKEKNEIPVQSKVIKRIAEKKKEEARKRAEEKGEKVKEKNNKKRLNEVSDQVKTYLETIKGFKSALEFAISDAKSGIYSPESKNFIVKKHEEIKILMNELESLI